MERLAHARVPQCRSAFFRRSRGPPAARGACTELCRHKRAGDMRRKATTILGEPRELHEHFSHPAQQCLRPSSASAPPAITPLVTAALLHQKLHQKVNVLILLKPAAIYKAALQREEKLLCLLPRFDMQSNKNATDSLWRIPPAGIFKALRTINVFR